MAIAAQASGNPPIDYAVAVWLGTPNGELERGLREGWIRRPPGAAETSPSEHGGPTSLPATEVGAATLQRWLARLDASVDATAFDTLWSEAGGDDATRSRTLARFVAASLGLGAGERIDAQRVEAAIALCDGRAHVVRLAGRSGTELETLAQQHAGVRRALVEHSPWALTGDRRLAALADPAGRYDRFDPDSGERLLSDAWLGDRARHASWQVNDAERVVAGDGWRFVDRAQPEATVEIASASGGAVHQVIFARDGGDSVTGGGTTDRLHGGDGDDTLRGRGGDDLLEGGDGADLLLGGGGRDDIAGGRGDDELDGGAGGDLLDGGGGDDVLTGGRGDDLLRGGAGDDVYSLARGDGIDVVEDDGGTLLLDEIEVAGVMQREGEAWRSADGRCTFALVDGVGERALEVRIEGEAQSIRLAQWQQGRYGITLAGLDGELTQDEAAAETFYESSALDVAAAVDARAVAEALAESAVPKPPGAGVAVDVTTVTAAGVAAALADSGAGDEGSESVLTTPAWSPEAPAWWREGVVPRPPEFALPRSG